MADSQEVKDAQAQAFEAAQLEKLRLEIDKLRADSRWERRVARYLSVITVLATIGGLWFGAIRYFSEQQTERRLRVQTQIRTDIAELLQFPHDTRQTVSRALFLLQDLKGLIRYEPSDESRVTEVLLELISRDLDFDKLRDTRFDSAALRVWDAYRERLRQNAAAHEFIVYRYVQALRKLHDEDPEYFEEIRYEPGFGYRVKRYTDELRFLRFESAVGGFSAHLQVMSGRADARRSAVARFGEALRNRPLAEQLFEGREGGARDPAGVPR